MRYLLEVRVERRKKRRDKAKERNMGLKAIQTLSEFLFPEKVNLQNFKDRTNENLEFKQFGSVIILFF